MNLFSIFIYFKIKYYQNQRLQKETLEETKVLIVFLIFVIMFEKINFI